MEMAETRKKTRQGWNCITLLGQGYKAMQEGRESSIEEVKKRIKQRREQGAYR